jgi:hypothetical protein
VPPPPDAVSTNRRASARWAAGLAALAAIALLTLWPGRSEAEHGFSWCFACGEFGAIDVLLNVALFFPFGAALAWGRAFSIGNTLRALVASLVVSTIIELLQLGVIRGRDPSLSDIVANALGGALGASVAHEGTWPIATWRRLSWMLALTASALLLFGQWALEPSAPRETYYAQWLPQRPAYVPFNGTLHSFALDAIALPPAAVLEAGALPDEFFEGRLHLQARVTAGPAPHGIALIARLALASGELVMLGRAEDAFVFRYRANAARVGFRNPIFALPDAFTASRNAIVQLDAALKPGSAALSAAGDGVRVTHTFKITMARGWSLLLPWNVALGESGQLFDAAWLALLFGVVGYAAARSRLRFYAAWPLELLALAYVCLTSIAPVAPEWSEWIGAVAGAALGFWLGARRRSQSVSDGP